MLLNSSCNGFCEEGYFCEAGSVSPTQSQCGDANHFCPRGSASPHQVDEGYYSIGGFTSSTRTLQKKCEPGFWCKDGVKSLCEPGYFGQDFGLVSSYTIFVFVNQVNHFRRINTAIGFAKQGITVLWEVLSRRKSCVASRRSTVPKDLLGR